MAFCCIIDRSDGTKVWLHQSQRSDPRPKLRGPRAFGRIRSPQVQLVTELGPPYDTRVVDEAIMHFEVVNQEGKTTTWWCELDDLHELLLDAGAPRVSELEGLMVEVNELGQDPVGLRFSQSLNHYKSGEVKVPVEAAAS